MQVQNDDMIMTLILVWIGPYVHVVGHRDQQKKILKNVFKLVLITEARI